MTIEEAIEIIKAYRGKLMNSPSNQLDGDIKVFEIAIRSLEAWQKVREDIEFERDRKLGGEAFEAVQYKSFQKCLDIIDRHCEKEQSAEESRDIRDIAIQGYIGTMMCNGFSIAEIEKVLKGMKEGNQ